MRPAQLAQLSSSTVCTGIACASEESSSFIVNGVTEINQHIAGVQHDVNTSRKRRRRDADMRSVIWTVIWKKKNLQRC